MRKACYCGRTGQVEDRKLIVDGDGAEALECRGCDHLERLLRMPQEARGAVPEEARRRDHGTRDVAA